MIISRILTEMPQGSTPRFKMAAKPKFSTTPASVIYSQSWPVPSSNSSGQRYPARPNSNSVKKSINSLWICKSKKNIPKPQKVVSSPAHKSYSWASSMLSNNYPGWLEDDSQVMLDMAKEFKITLQMFKKLTEQVKEVDEQLSSGRKPYSFKHYFKNKSSHNSLSSIKTYTPEIPMTNEAYQPCNNLGSKTEQRLPSCQLRTERKTAKFYSTSELKLGAWSFLNTTKANTRNLEKEPNDTENDSISQSLRLPDDDFRNGTNLNLNDESVSWSSCLDFSDDDNHIGLGYIDPVPADWQERKLEELELEFCSEKSGSDPFMRRYLQLRRLEIETVEQEKRSDKSEGNCESFPCLGCEGSKTTISGRGKKSTNGNSNGKKQTWKGNDMKGALENVGKNSRRVLKKSNQSSSSLRGFETTGEQKEAKTLDKESKDLLRETYMDAKKTSIENSEKRSACKSAKGKRRVQSCKARPVSHPSSSTYDILELAISFDPPSKERIKLNCRPVTAKSAKSKGMLPGKSWSSQRRFSLTAGQSLQNMPSENSDPVVSKSRALNAKKSCKKRRKRCCSSKV